ncbi:CheY chemotaxis protein or a CheY-like REC (receiver) domain [Enhydrobacter aerosaccus]|uniref:CheY chemotaxis protein or a CheY-like REC (Receiver) domain n=1 Tax=Enhydrobacter aerosaccus TaxID=225324 RepID=A0A1T4LIT7_9HYPH|nr:response regulator [Enhydrobacter aerosaccus]SJZ54324.1 CheY chemotaxis protein or a CheY-like REC (receiver) domain [Enhydrobacter aerosaccus]
MFEGSKILVVEDNYLLAEVVCEFVLDCGMEPIGPASGVETGLVYARQAPLDGALLDINLDDRFCFPICAMLAQRSIPFAFLTGYSHLSLIPQAYRHVPLVAKPFDPDELKGVIHNMLDGRRDGPLVRAASSIARLAAVS